MKDKELFPGKQRRFFTIRMEPYRAELFIALAEEAGKKHSDLFREIIYKHLEENIDELTYRQAKESDELEWQQVINNRIEGKALAKLIRENKKIE